MEILNTLAVRLIGEGSSFVRMMNEAGEQTKALSKRVTSLGKKVTALSAPIALFSAGAVASFASFDDAMVKSTSIMGDLEASTVASMRAQAIALSRDGASSARDLAEGYFFLASAGLSAEQQMAALPQVQKFATAGAFDLATATDLATDAQSALGLASQDAEENLRNLTRVTDVLVGANTLANASVVQFATSLTNKSAAALRSANKEIEEGVAVLAAYADQGTKGAKAGEMLATLMRELQQRATENEEEFKKLGISVFDADGNMQHLADIVENFEAKMGSMSAETRTAALQTLKFGAEAQNALTPLIGMSDKLRILEGRLQRVQGITGEVADKQLKSFTAQGKIAQNQLTAIAIDIGGVLAPKLMVLNEIIGEASDLWFSLSDAQKSYIITAGGVVTATGPVLIILGQVMGALANLKVLIPIFTGVGTAGSFAFKSVAAAIGTAITAVVGFTGIWVPVVAGFALVSLAILGPGGVTEAFSFLGQIAVATIQTIPRLLAFAAGVAVNLFSKLGSMLVQAFTGAVSFVGNVIVAGFKAAFNLVLTVISTVASAISSVFSALFSGDLVGAVKIGLGFMWKAFTGLFSQVATALYKLVTLDFDYIRSLSSDFSAGASGDNLSAALSSIAGDQFQGISFDTSTIDGLGIPDFSGFGLPDVQMPEVPDFSSLTRSIEKATSEGVMQAAEVVARDAEQATPRQGEGSTEQAAEKLALGFSAAERDSAEAFRQNLLSQQGGTSVQEQQLQALNRIDRGVNKKKRTDPNSNRKESNFTNV